MFAFLFPGQGASLVQGMGQELFSTFSEAREVFDEVDDALDQKLSTLTFKGPFEELSLTENAQPALMAVSVAAFRVLKQQGGLSLSKIRCFAGHSLGEYSALTCADVIPLAETARLLRIRGQAMQKAVPVGQGAMAAVLGLTVEDIEAICTKASTPEQICELANDNAPGQVVISGHAEAIERAMALASEKGAKRCVPLPVSAPFHCSLMQPAAEAMAEALAPVVFSAPSAPIIPNVTASEESDPSPLKANLITQVTGRVRWTETLKTLGELGVTTTVEVGSGKVLTGLAKRAGSFEKGISLHTPQDIESFLKAA